MGTVTLSQEKWDAMGEAERALASKLGIRPTPTKAVVPSNNSCNKPRVRVSSTLKTYTLGIITDCKLCGDCTIDIYNMVRSNRGNEVYLEARKVHEQSVIPDKWEVRATKSCLSCRNNLRHWTKQMLIDKVLEQAAALRAVKVSVLRRKSQEPGIPMEQGKKEGR